MKEEIEQEKKRLISELCERYKGKVSNFIELMNEIERIVPTTLQKGMFRDESPQSSDKYKLLRNPFSRIEIINLVANKLFNRFNPFKKDYFDDKIKRRKAKR